MAGTCCEHQCANSYTTTEPANEWNTKAPINAALAACSVALPTSPWLGVVVESSCASFAAKNVVYTFQSQ